MSCRSSDLICPLFLTFLITPSVFFGFRWLFAVRPPTQLLTAQAPHANTSKHLLSVNFTRKITDKTHSYLGSVSTDVGPARSCEFIISSRSCSSFIIGL
uniref:Uncharacterized protein n=1 Tax=Anguilla anguilla TaxID=7936 RepID=A0A0E9RM71_ANGAN